MTEHAQHGDEDPRHHAEQLRGLLTEVIEYARNDANKVADPKAQGLFETAAEVCIGLTTALQHYEARSERAWER
ncbi:hypothetical protein HDA32_005485 [Spinactinospora alkalitolerans]|uniref:Uncharacterized protein n=1 Tax=Spinactinospora alkalitolerans TaxID=687207 RepID=A0A852U4C7_9ACTN|nr:hypothetical protein [Spinactinospora alkalitolerans]NYE50365.1 hypothetical protein [Spinactinospora alkalitolerans]